ncbi:T9SS type A sorting domain-containing protein [bacterium]|nr:T9SS type A sorting domain-containing protein [bacterium]
MTNIKNIVIFSVIFLSILTEVSLSWEIIYGDPSVEEEALRVIECSSGGFLTVGFKDSQILVIRFSEGGDIIWDRVYGYGAKGYDVIEASPGKYLICGYGTVSPPPSKHVSPLLLKIDDLGDTIWTRVYSSYIGIFKRIVAHRDGGYLLMESSVYSTGLFKIDDYGDTSWVRVSSAPDGLKDLIVNSEGHYVACGRTTPEYVGDSLVLLEFDGEGDTIWIRKYDFVLGDGQVIEDPISGYLILSYGSIDFPNSYYIRTNEIGDTIWTKKYSYDEEVIMYDIVTCRSGGYLSVGDYGYLSPYWGSYFLRINDLAESTWTRLYETDYGGGFFSVIETPMHNYIGVGYVKGHYGPRDVFILCTDSLGISVPDTDYIRTISEEMDFEIKAYPNPFNSSMKITLRLKELPHSNPVITINNILGERVYRTTIQGKFSSYQMKWMGVDDNGKEVESGIYFVNVILGNERIKTSKVVLIK